MNYKASLIFQNNDFSSQELFDVLNSEDFDFQGKEIEVLIEKKEEFVEIQIICKKLHHLKIATTAVINSMTVIEKTLDIINN